MKNDLATDCRKKEMTPINAIKNSSIEADKINFPLAEEEAVELTLPISTKAILIKAGMDAQAEIDNLGFSDGVIFDDYVFGDIAIDTTLQPY